MNSYFLFAAAIAVLVGVVHSILGEVLIFGKLRSGGIVPMSSAPPLQSRNIRILWATWHLASVLGFAAAGILLALADSASTAPAEIAGILATAFGCGSALVLFATRGRHPGWIGLASVAILVFLGSSA